MQESTADLKQGDGPSSAYSGVLSGAHAVRWGRWENAYGDTKWTRWHWTDDADTTLCGRHVQTINDRWPHLPDTDDDPERVDCHQCRRTLSVRAR